MLLLSLPVTTIVELPPGTLALEAIEEGTLLLSLLLLVVAGTMLVMLEEGTWPLLRLVVAGTVLVGLEEGTLPLLLLFVAGTVLVMLEEGTFPQFLPQASMDKPKDA
ncbi:MAG TPA: hypothetical protein VK133_03915 [Amoebophilaceae bacterium]|nr:hypothetical protein [Amoebophilaceae bacterium]